MFAVKPWTETVTRVLLITVVVFNALVPTTALAMSVPEEAEVDSTSVLSDSGSGIKGALAKYSGTSLRSPTVFQDGTQTSLPVEAAVETPTSEPSMATTVTLENTSTATETSTPILESTPTVLETPTASETITQTAPQAAVSQPPVLSFKLSATPEQAGPGDEVTFTAELTNTGQTPASGLLFSNILPEDFGNAQGGFKDFNFDPQTRLLTWSGAQAGVPTLAPGQKVSLTYTIRMNSQRDEVQLVDSASFKADGLTEPLRAEATLTLLLPQKHLTMLGPGGGKALGLNGHIQVRLPQNAVNAPRGILIKDLNDGVPPVSDQPWQKFALEMRVPNPANAQPLQEQDRIIPLESVEAKFDQPVELAFSFAGLTDLSALAADKRPFLVTLDESSGTWVRVPLNSIDLATNQVTAQINHFSTWGIGIGSAFPTNGANILLFDNDYSDLFTGRTRYSLPIWTPPGRNGMAPALSFSYSSGSVDGVLGDVQAPWAGMGWSFDTVEIARKITNGVCGAGCGGGGTYGYENKFLLLFNGTGYELLPDGTTAGRYHTKSESFLYIQLHNNNLGNNTPAASNATSEWWEVVQKDGTRWRLGATLGSEQLAAMKGYPGAATGTWAALGYAGGATDVVTSSWRADQVTDLHGNRMTFTYFEETRPVAGLTTTYDRASYMDTISYTEHTSGTPTPGYSVVFTRQSRAGTEVPMPAANDWDNWDTFRLGRIDIKYGATVVRTYDMSYQVRPYSSGSTTWQTTVLDTIIISGGGTTAPTIRFTYEDDPNRAVNGTTNQWPYPRLASVTNGWGGTVSFAYESDGRASTSWYNWRTTTLDVDPGPTSNPMETTYAYGTPCYKVLNPPDAWTCNSTNPGELVGYDQTTATTKDFNTLTLAIDVHKFHTDLQKAGREYEVQRQNASATTLSKTSTTYTVVTTGFPASGYFTYASAVDEYLYSTSLNLISHTEYVYDTTTTGNLTTEKDFDGTPTLYRQIDYQYVTNTSNPSTAWILDKVARRILKDGSLAVVSTQEYGYDGSLPASGSPTLGDLTLSRQVNGTQTIDTKYIYDSYGNVTETQLFKSFGTTSTQPSGLFISNLTGYDTALKTYVVSTDPPLIPATVSGYDFGLGLPTTVTDANGNTTTTAYDGLGRITSITYPGSAQQNVKYTYPSLPVTAPFAVKMEMWDQPASVYRSAWQIMDGLGRVIQTQGPYVASGTTDNLVLNDTSYNAQGLVLYTGLPRTLNGTGGTHFAPTWASIPNTATSYDALGRVSSVAYPDSSTETSTYSGLLTTIKDRNNHQKVQENDAFGRLWKVYEYTGSTSPYTLYATTIYEYNVRDQLKKVTDTAGNQTTIGYNGFGRKDSMTDPDLGAWSYGYDVIGNLTTQTDARTCVTTVAYDDLNRPTLKSYTGPGACNPTPDVTYTYDSIASGNEGLGRRTGMSDSNSSTTWKYNILGQVINETHTIESTNYGLSTTFDAFGRPLTQTLPNAEGLTYTYNSMGALSSLAGTNTYVSQINYAASGQVKDQLLGNNLLQQSCYDTNTLRLTNLRVYGGTLQNCGTTPASPRLNLSYTYQNNGNVSQINDDTRSEVLNYTYDELDRLLNVTGAYSQNYTYNPIGNTTSKAYTLEFTALATGDNHTCGVTRSGGVKCWGGNGSGQLGDNSTTDHATPVDVSGLTSGVVALAAGDGHTCALTTGGGVKCWGMNTNGQLGNASTTDSLIPVNVSGLTSGVAAITAGDHHTCALTTAGAMKCWGSNSDGQLGNGSTTDSSTPVSVNTLTSGVAAISAGDNHTCALKTTGGMKCWGRNLFGRLGDGTTTQRTAPVDVSGLTSGVAAIAAGDEHTCAVTTGGGAKCWGRNNFGQLGDGTTTDHWTAVDVSGLTSGVATATAGDEHTCARTTAGGAKCWGHNNYGQLGDGTTTDHLSAVDVSGLTSGVASIVTRQQHTCILTTNGMAKCWGNNGDSQLGNGTMPQSTTAVDVTGLTSGVAAIDAGDRHSCVLTTGGGVQCWGSNTDGQLGDGTTNRSDIAVNVSGLASGVAKIATGYKHTCVVTTAGGAKCWGNNAFGELGNNSTTDSTTAVDVSGLTTGVAAIATGMEHTCALTTAGGVKCWGKNTNGQLGNASTIDSSTPVNVSTLTSGVAAIAIGDNHSCALTTTGAVKCWGSNSNGQLGNNSTTDSSTPVAVSNLGSGVATIAAGSVDTCAVTSGGAKCWGSNSFGQVGDGTTTQRKVPTDVSGLTSGVSAIDVGDRHTCALTTGGGVKCWGKNLNGQLGDGTTTDHQTAVDVSGLTSGVAAIGTRQDHTCALTTGGGAKCWGIDNYGNLGDGFNYYSTTPLIVYAAGMTYAYDAVHKHAVSTLSTGETYTYDANGNMITRVEGGLTYTQTFDAENRLISVVVSGQTTSFVYDGDGNLVKKINPGGSKTLYVGGIYEVDKTSGGTVTGTKTYYPAAGAMRVGSTLYYVLKDQLGSASVVTNTSGTMVGEDRFYPFGETRFTTGTMQTDKLFTGQREMAGLGIYNYGARFYSPKLGRFLSADTIVPRYANPQNLNRFSYVNNNPLRYVDPTGHMLDDGCRTGCSYTPPPATNYCTTHPGSCGGGGSGGGGGGGTQMPVIRTPIATTTTTPTTNPTLSSILTNVPFSLMLTPLPTNTPSPEYVLGQAPSSTPTATPSVTPVPFNLKKKINEEIENAEPFAPDPGSAIPMDCAPEICGPIVLVNTIYNATLLTLKVLKDELDNGPAVNPYYGSPSPTTSPTLTTSPLTVTPLSTPYMQTPTNTPTAPTPSPRTTPP